MSFRKLLAAVVVVSLVFGLVGTSAFAAGEEQLYNEAAQLLLAFKILADPNDLRPGDEITRAELIKILVAAMGKNEDAKLLAGAPAFSDTQKHWASGYAALAKNAGITVGYPDGTFKPENKVTNAEAVTMLARFVKLAAASGTWPENYITAATDAGIIPAEIDVAKYAALNAIRGVVFVLANNAFTKVLVDGQNTYQKYFDSVPPVIAADAVSTPTEDTSVTVSGKVSDAAALWINGDAAALGADGSFSADIPLAIGANTIILKAIDLVGNEATSKIAIERVNAPAAAIDVPASITVAAGGSVDVAAAVKDANGEEIASPALSASVSAEGLGSWADGVFTAGEKAGSGTLTFKVGDVTADVAVTVEPAALAKVEVSPAEAALGIGALQKFTAKGFDAFGNEVSGISATFSATGTGGVVNPATGEFIGSAAGNFTVTASVGGVSGTATAKVFGTAAKVVVTPAATSLVGNNNSTLSVSVSIVDANGNLVANADTTGVSVAADNPFIAVTAGDATKTGVRTFTVKTTGGVATWGRTIKLTASATGLTSGTATFSVASQTASGVKVFADPETAYITANDVTPVTVKASVLDQAGYRMLAGAWVVNFSASGPATLGASSGAYTVSGSGPVDASVSVSSVKGVTGAVTITGTVTGVGSGNLALTSAVATAPASVQITVENDTADTSSSTGKAAGLEALKVNLRAVDKNGVPVPSAATLKVTVTVDDTKADQVSYSTTSDTAGFTALSASTKTFNVTLVGGTKSFWIKANAFTGALPLAIADTASTDALAGGSTNLTFVAGDAVNVKFSTAVAIAVQASSPKATLTAQITDAAGNAVAQSGVKVGFTSSSANVTLNGVDASTTALDVNTDANGAVSVEVVARPYTGVTYTITLSSGGTYKTATGGPTSLTVKDVIPASVTVEITDGVNPVGAVTAGTVLYVKATLKDSFGNVIPAGTGNMKPKVAAGEISKTGTLPDSSTLSGCNADGFCESANPSTGVYTYKVVAAKAGTLTIQVDNVDTAVTISGSLNVGTIAGAAYKVVLVEGKQTLAKGVEAGPFTLQVSDFYGNATVANSATATTVTFTTSVFGGTSSLAVRTAPGGANLASTDIGVGMITKQVYLIGTNTSGTDVTGKLFTSASGAFTHSDTTGVDITVTK